MSALKQASLMALFFPAAVFGWRLDWTFTAKLSPCAKLCGRRKRTETSLPAHTVSEHFSKARLPPARGQSLRFVVCAESIFLKSCALFSFCSTRSNLCSPSSKVTRSDPSCSAIVDTAAGPRRRRAPRSSDLFNDFSENAFTLAPILQAPLDDGRLQTSTHAWLAGCFSQASRCSLAQVLS
jgi:hypothetical protein